jgi:urease accessory protein
MNQNKLFSLLQLSSPSLPIGAYTYSQGLESAIDQGSVTNEDTAREWIIDSLRIVSDFEAPILLRLMKAYAARDTDLVASWGECFIASRDTAELRAETVQMGFSLGTLITDLKLLDESLLKILNAQTDLSLPSAFACATEALSIPHEDALRGMLFSMIENQVLVCVKSVPLGQRAGQHLLFSLHSAIESAAIQAESLEDDELTNWAPGLSLLSMQHEVQYSRIYRS